MVLKILKLSLYVGVLAIVLHGLLPHRVFTPYSIQPAVKLEGPYALNTLLNDAEHLFSGMIKGPENLVEINGEIYTGLHGGNVVKLKDKQVIKVAKFGESCDGIWQEEKCGRPFGLAAGQPGKLYVADAYYGIWEVDIENGNTKCLVSKDTVIDGKVPRIFNSVAVSKDGDLYWTDSSTDVGIQDGVIAVFLDGSGRLMKHSMEKNSSEVLLKDLYFPTGVILSPQEDFVVMSEMVTSRLLKYYISGPKTGSTEVFLDGLPGFPDKLRAFGDLLLVPLVHARDSSDPVMFQYVAPHTLVRELVYRTLALLDYTCKLLHDALKVGVFQKMQNTIGHFESVSQFAPKRVTILVVNWNGEVVDSLHNLDSSLEAIGDVLVSDDHLYFGSPYNTYLGRVKINFEIKK